MRQCGGRIIDKTLKNWGAQSDEAPLAMSIHAH
jgi:hypothetical protein